MNSSYLSYVDTSRLFSSFTSVVTSDKYCRKISGKLTAFVSDPLENNLYGVALISA